MLRKNLFAVEPRQQPETDGTDDWEQPASEQPPAVQGTQDGKRAANFSLLFGFLSPLSFVLGFWLLVQGLGESGLQVALAAPVLNILGIWQGWVAQRHGVPALAGRILSWAGVIFALPFAIIVALFLIVLTGGI